MIKKITLLITSTISIASCATMFNGGSQTIIVNPTNPDDNPKVKITTSDGSYMAKLPATVSSSPSTFNEVIIDVQDECYQPLSVRVGKTITASYWANIFNIYGFFIDPLSGAMWKLDSQVAVPAQEIENCKNKDSKG
jgi:hypothetical protein